MATLRKEKLLQKEKIRLLQLCEVVLTYQPWQQDLGTYTLHSDKLYANVLILLLLLLLLLVAMVVAPQIINLLNFAHA